MTEREILTQLIGEVTAYSYGNMATVKDEAIAEHLIMRGVITLPCKLYDTVYLLVKGKAEVRFFINYKCELIIVIEYKENGCIKTGNYKWSSFSKWVFITREEAKKALAERTINNEN